MAHDHHHGPGGHQHGLATGQLDRAMAIGVGLNLAFVAIELAAGFWAGSLALLADAGHNASDVLGLLLAWGADWLARRPPSRKFTWGLRRTTILAALGNAVLLLVACGGILWEAWHRLREPAPVAGLTVITVAGIGVVINTFTALLFVRGHGDANVRGAYLHMAADAAVAAGVVVAGLAIAATGLDWIDSVVSMLIAALIIAGTWGLFRESLDLAMDAVPRGFDTDAATAALAAIPGVAEVHDLHAWAASTKEVSLTAHLVVADDADRDAVLDAATNLARDTYHVAHVTLQLESPLAGEHCRQRPGDVL